jgi:ParB family chromosome partitioning protein
MNKPRLGLGLDALLGSDPAPVAIAESRRDGVADLPLAEIRPNPWQPRAAFDEEDLRSLAASIRASGVIQPVVVRRSAPGYELVAGERRFRAAKLAGLAAIPAVVRDVDERSMLVLALVENLQRRDLNAIEKAKALRQLMQMNTWTQEQAAESVGLSRPTVANFLRLLELPAEAQEAVSRGTLTMGHARALLATSNAALQRQLLKRIVDEDLSVRVVEKIVAGAAPAKAGRPAARRKDPAVEDLEQRLTQFFGTRVELVMRTRGGQIVVNWFSTDQFNGLLRKLGV